MRPLYPLAALLLVFAAPAMAADANPNSPCGDSVVIRQSDTLSSIAARCDVSEASLLRANPSIQGSSDLQVGAKLKVETGTAQGVGAAVSTFSRRASNAIGEIASDVGSTAQDLLDKNPDLKARLDKLGRQVGLTGQDHATDAAVTPQSGAPGSTVTISASGLPKDSPIAIGAGAPGTAYNVIGHAQSTANGDLMATLKTPAGAQPGEVLVFSVATSSGVVARTGRFTVR